jgi:ATP-dependent dihydroxyacetone kinase
MKKLINDPRRVVREMLEGLADLHQGHALLASEDVIVQADLPPPAARPVAVLSGGGSGHEPAHAGYVGSGMLTAAIAGDVFTSPSVDAVLAAIRAVGGPAGAVLVVKNYTGDRLNFGLAAELATAEGIPTRVVVVADDVALHDTVPPGQRRGIAGTVLVHKVAGAAASAGLPLDAVLAEAEAAAAAIATMGVGLGACIVPAAGTPGFSLGDTEMELGLGIHGEQGVRRGPMQTADGVADTILATIVSQAGIRSGDRVALLVNGLGGTPSMELAIVARQALTVLRGQDIRVERAWVGNFMTALEMPGCSLTLMIVDDARLARLDAPATAPAWPGGGRIAERRIVPTPGIATADAAAASDAGAAGPLTAQLQTTALAVAAAFEREESVLTDLDGRTGDADLGISMVRGAAAIRALPDRVWATPAAALTGMGDAVRRAIAGSSGPFYAAALLRAARELGTTGQPDATTWAAAFAAGVEAVAELGGAQAGDRTMLDALLPATAAFSTALREGVSPAPAWRKAVEAAEAGAAATATMHPKLGRAAYQGERAIGHQDAGAAAVLVWMRAVADNLV